MASEWKDLSFPYFIDICRSVFDEYMFINGFVNISTEGGIVNYCRGECFLQLGYWLEDAPRYHPSVSIGFISFVNKGKKEESIGLWYAIEKEGGNHNYSKWVFGNDEELKRVLVRIKNEVVDIYAKPLWENPLRLKELISMRFKEIEINYKSEKSEYDKNMAIDYFNIGMFKESLDIYENLDPSALSSVDLKRIKIAKKRRH